MGTLTVPGRVRWAVDHIGPTPDAHILEVGCGPGAAAELICQRLATGHLTAIDRSATATGRTSARNAHYIESGRLEVWQCELARVALTPVTIDIAFSINVNLFWVGDPSVELAVLRQLMRPDGVLHIVYGAAGPTTDGKVISRIKRALLANGFAEPELHYSNSGFALTTRPDKSGQA